MRRPKPRDDEPSKAWRVPWWRTCKACDWRFLFEHSWAGWWHLGFDPPRVLPWDHGHVCLECAPTKEDARKHFGVIRPRRPDGPPPPPPPRPAGGPVPRVIVLPLDTSSGRWRPYPAEVPPAGEWCWIRHKGGNGHVHPAMHDEVRGWHNSDTWEDFEDEIDGFIVIPVPVGSTT